MIPAPTMVASRTRAAHSVSLAGRRGYDETVAGGALRRLLQPADAVLAGHRDERMAPRGVLVAEHQPRSQRQLGITRADRRRAPTSRAGGRRLVRRPRSILDDADQGGPAQRAVRADGAHAEMIPGNNDATVCRVSRPKLASSYIAATQALAAGIGLDRGGDGEDLGLLDRQSGVVGERAERCRFGELGREVLASGRHVPIELLLAEAGLGSRPREPSDHCVGELQPRRCRGSLPVLRTSHRFKSITSGGKPRFRAPNGHDRSGRKLVRYGTEKATRAKTDLYGTLS